MNQNTEGGVERKEEWGVGERLYSVSDTDDVVSLAGLQL